MNTTTTQQGATADHGTTDQPQNERLIATYVAMRPDLIRFLAARLGDRAAADDVYQDMYLRLQGSQLPPEIENERAFLYKTAANLASDHRRGGQRRSARDKVWVDAVTQRIGADAVVDAVEPEAAIDSRRRLEALAAHIGELSPKCREVFVLHKLEGLGHAEVAARLGISRKTVEKHMTTALKSLAAKLGNREATP